MAGNLGHLAATVSLNIDPFKSSARALSSTIKATAAELKAQDAAFKGSGKSLNGMKSTYSALERQSRNYAAQLKSQQATYDKLTKSLNDESAAAKRSDADTQKLTARQANAASAYNKTSAQIEMTRNRMAALSKSIALESNSWTKASEKAAAFSKVTGAIGTKLSSFGSKMTQTVSAPIAIGFAAAAKSAINFNSQIDAIGPLMTNGAAVTGKFRGQLDQMADSSKRWAVQYGISTTSINQGLADLVRAGYTAGQSMKMMPAILDASRASGEDFNGVMEVVTSTMTQFGVKAGNTTKVTDAMTYAANATKSGFSDMGEAMEYTGQSAHSAGISLNTTVAAIGLLSNAGLKGSMAGTAFNMAIQKLASASTAANSPMSKLGVNVAAFKKGQIGLPEVIEEVTKATSGMSKAQKVAAVTAAFGERGGRAILALVNAGAPALRKLTSETANATGATKKVSDMMGTTAKANFDRLKSSVQVLGIEIGQKLLPALTPMISKATQMVDAFGKLDSGTQQSIVKFGLFLAAIGPVSSVLGKLFNVAKGGGSAFASIAGGLGRAGAAAKLHASAFDVLKSTFSKTAFEALKVAPAAEKTGSALLKTGTEVSAVTESGTGLLATLAPMAPALIGVGVAVGAGVAVWELWGKKAYEAGQRADKWGSDIGAAADKSASSMKRASGEISGALGNTNQTITQNAKQISAGFNSMTKAAKKAADESDSAAKKLAKSLGGDASDELLKAAAKEKSANDKRISQMQANAKKAEQITRSSSKNQENLTADQIQVIKNLQADSAANAVKTLNLSGKQQNNVTKAILGERVSMSKAAATRQYQDMQVSLQEEYEANTKAQNKIKNDAKLSTAEKNATLEGLERDHQTKLKAIYTGAIQAMKAEGDSNHEIQARLQSDFDLTASQASSAMRRYKDAMSGAVDSSNTMVAVTTNVTGKVKKAGESWNSLVLDPKTMNVKSNLPEVLKDTANTKSGWKQLTFDLKYAKISSNAKQAIVDAMAASKQWQSMPDWKKDAIITTQGRGELISVMQQFKTWDSFTLKEQRAIVHGDYTALVDALIKEGDWNQMSPKEKQAVVHDKATVPLMNALVKTGQWNSMPTAVKSAIVNAKGSVQVAELALQYGHFNSLPNATKKAALDDAGFRMKLAGTITSWSQFKALPNAEKKALLDDSDVRAKLIAAGILIDKYNLNNPKKKTARADTANATNNFGLGTKAVNTYKKASPGPTKVGKGDTKNTQNAMKSGQNSINKYKGTTPGATKVGKGDTRNTQSAMNNGANTVAKYRRASPGGTKHGTASFSKPGFSGVMSAISSFASKHSSHKSFISEFISIFTTKHKKAKGDPNFEGGVAIVNDAPGGVYREMITLPTGEQFSPVGRNVTLGLPKHTKIETAMNTASHYNIPRFANGTSDFTGATNSLQNLNTGTVQPVTVMNNNDAATVDTDPIIANQRTQITIFQQQNNLLTRMVDLLASSSTSDTGRSIRQLMNQMSTVNEQIGRGQLS